MDVTLTGTNSVGENGTESNDNEGVLHIPQTPRLEPHYLILFDVISKIVEGFKHYYLTLIQLNIIHSFSLSQILSSPAHN